MTSGISGLRVLDLAGPAGVYATKLLADLGADVIRIEPPAGDPFRSSGPYFRDTPGPDRSLPFAFYNTSKRSITLDLESPDGRDSFRRLAAGSDLVFETATPGSLDSLGIGYQALSQSNPGLVWAAITPFGQTGPRAHWKGTDLIAMAAGGVLWVSGFPGKPPVYSPLDQAYHHGSVAAVSGALVALQHRHTTGLGQFVDVSLQATVATGTESVLSYWDSMGWNWTRNGEFHYSGFQMVYRCKDGWIVCLLGQRWANLVDWAEEVGIISSEWRDPRWFERGHREANADTISRLARSLFEIQTVDAVVERAQHYRVGIQPVQHIPDLFVDPQLAFRGYWTAVAHDHFGTTLTYPGAPFQSSSGFWRIRSRAPLPGEHTEDVLNAIPEPRTVGPVTPATASDRKPLAGIRVIDFSQAGTGPLATRTLADHGAEVIKVEWSQKVDVARNNLTPRTPGQDGPNASPNWNALNASKRSLTVNMNLPGAHELLRSLIRISDVVLDNYGKDPFPKWGFSYDELRAINPDIIMMRSSVMGRTGPRNGYVGLGNGIAAAAGWNAMMGNPGDPPVGIQPAYPDFSVNCHHMLIAIFTALEHRRKTGEGQYIDLSQHESTITWIGPAILDYTANGRLPEPRRNRHPSYAPHGVFPVQGNDRWVAIAVDESTWPAFCDVASAIHLRIPAFATHDLRKANEDDLEATIAAWTATQDGPALVELLQAAGIPASILSTGEDLLADPQLAHRQHYVQLTHPETGLHYWDRNPFLLTTTPGWPTLPPLLGEHNDWVLQEVLGMDDEAVSQVYVDGIVD